MTNSIISYNALRLEIGLKILSYLGPKDVLCVSEICKLWNKIALDNALWQPFYMASFPKKYPPLVAHLQSSSLFNSITWSFCFKWDTLLNKNIENQSLQIKEIYLNAKKLEISNSQKPPRLIDPQPLELMSEEDLSDSMVEEDESFPEDHGSFVMDTSLEVAVANGLIIQENCIVRVARGETLSFLDFENETLQKTIHKKLDEISSIALYEEIAFVGLEDGTIELWDLEESDDEPFDTLETGVECSIVFLKPYKHSSSKKALVAVTSNGVVLNGNFENFTNQFNMTSSTGNNHPIQVNWLANELILVQFENNEIGVWNLHSQSQIPLPSSLAPFPEKIQVMNTTVILLPSKESSTLQIWDFSKKTLKFAHLSYPLSVCMMKEQELVFGLKNGVIEIHDYQGTLIQSWQAHPTSVIFLDHLNEDFIVSASLPLHEETVVKIWNRRQQCILETTLDGKVIEIKANLGKIIFSFEDDRMTIWNFNPHQTNGEKFIYSAFEIISNVQILKND